MLHALVYAATPSTKDYQQLIRQAASIQGMVKAGVLDKTQIPDPHWRKDACMTCHISSSDGEGGPLKTQADRTCFYCHRAEDHLVIHPVDLVPDKQMQARMPKEFRDSLSRGNTSCLTCHDILMQCKKRTMGMHLRNSAFIRGGYYNSRTGVCYQCHNNTAYKKLNPHDQISDKGVLNEDKCLICHKYVPRQGHAAGVAELTMQVDSDWAEICLNCHRWQPHPGGNMAIFSGGKPPNHLVVPDDRIRDRLTEMMQTKRLDMPLDPSTGKVYCATCHNPHERGVIKKISLAKGADEKNRLRSKRICINCHEK
jgi:hypothetical protein